MLHSGKRRLQGSLSGCGNDWQIAAESPAQSRGKVHALGDWQARLVIGERQANLSGGAGTPLSGGLRRAAGIDNEYGPGNVLCFVAHEEINTIGDVLDFS